MQSFKDPKWKAFVEKCRKRVSDDNKELGINSVFLPQPEICCKPKVLIIAMEPGMGSKEKIEKLVKEGHKGFVHFVIDYCAHKHICGGKFQYQLVDFCKGAMTIKDANKNRAKRYKNWLPLLKEEWELLGKPPIIAVGKGICNTINKMAKQEPGIGLKIDNYIIHYSKQAAGYRKKEYDYFKLKTCNTKAEMKKTIEKLLKLLGFKEPFIQKTWGETINKDSNKKQLIALYRHNFEDFKSNGKIRHLPTLKGAKK